MDHEGALVLVVGSAKTNERNMPIMGLSSEEGWMGSPPRTGLRCAGHGRSR